MRNRLAMGLTITAVLALAATGLFAADTAHENFDQTYSFAPGAKLSLDNTNGDIRIEPWDRDEIRVSAVKRVKSRRGSAEEALDEVKIEIDTSGGGLTIDTVYPRWKQLFGWSEVSAAVEYEIQLPRSAELDIQTVNGEVEVQGITGRIELRSTNGGIQVTDASGSVRASTTNGGIRVELNEVSGSAMDFETTNGGIRLYLPQSVRATVDARTTNGSIDTDFPIEVRGTYRRTRLEGDINGGGPTISLHTTNGGIKIRER